MPLDSARCAAFKNGVESCVSIFFGKNLIGEFPLYSFYDKYKIRIPGP